MRFTRWFIVLCAFFLLPRMPLAAQAPSIFEPKAERHQGPPLWISAEAVVDEETIVKLKAARSLAEVVGLLRSGTWQLAKPVLPRT